MLSKGTKLFPKASHLGVHLIYLSAKKLWFLFGFYIFPQPPILYIILFCIFCVLNVQKLSKRLEVIGSNENHFCKSANALLDLPLQLENS